MSLDKTTEPTLQPKRAAKEMFEPMKIQVSSWLAQNHIWKPEKAEQLKLIVLIDFFLQVKEADYDIIDKSIDKLMFYYGKADPWTPEQYYYDMKKVGVYGGLSFCGRMAWTNCKLLVFTCYPDLSSLILLVFGLELPKAELLSGLVALNLRMGTQMRQTHAPPSVMNPWKSSSSTFLQRYPDADIRLCTRNMEHAFVLEYSIPMAEVFWDWITEKLPELLPSQNSNSLSQVGNGINHYSSNGITTGIHGKR